MHLTDVLSGKKSSASPRTPKTATPRKTPPGAPKKPAQITVVRELFFSSDAESVPRKTKKTAPKKRSSSTPKSSSITKKRRTPVSLKEMFVVVDTHSRGLLCAFKTELAANKHLWTETASGRECEIRKCRVIME